MSETEQQLNINIDDFNLARSNLLDILDKGNEALNDLGMMARQSQAPRAYEVLTALIKTMVDSNKDLLELQKSKKELEAKQTNEFLPKVTNQLYITTADLQKLLNPPSESDKQLLIEAENHQPIEDGSIGS